MFKYRDTLGDAERELHVLLMDMDDTLLVGLLTLNKVRDVVTDPTHDAAHVASHVYVVISLYDGTTVALYGARSTAPYHVLPIIANVPPPPGPPDISETFRREPLAEHPTTATRTNGSKIIFLPRRIKVPIAEGAVDSSCISKPFISKTAPSFHADEP